MVALLAAFGARAGGEYLVTVTNLSGEAVLSVDGGKSYASAVSSWVEEGAPFVVRVAESAGRHVMWLDAPDDAIFDESGLFFAIESVLKPLSLQTAVFTPTHVWTGEVSADWATAGNWTDAAGEPVGAAPGADSVVYVPAPPDLSRTNAVTVSAAFSVAALYAGACTNETGPLTVTMAHMATNAVAGDVVVSRNATLTHASKKLLAVKADGSAYIAVKGTLDVTAKGFSQGGSGNGGNGQWYGCSYGGVGRGTGITLAKCYGSLLKPSDFGSGNTQWWWGYGGGTGGGVIYLSVARTLRVDGTVKSAGNWQSSGGSVHLNAGAIAGTGVINARGSTKGGGGRIAIYQTANDTWDAFTGTLDASGGESGAGPGTIYLESAADDGHGELLIDGKTCGGTCGLRTAIGGADHVFGHVTVTNGATLQLDAGVTLRTIRGITGHSGTVTSTTAKGAGVELRPEAGATATLDATLSVNTLSCSVPDATVRVAGGSSITVTEGGDLTLAGAKGALLNVFGDVTWPLVVQTDVKQTVQYVAVSNCNATGGLLVSAIGGVDKGGNSNWEFLKAIEPGDPIEWTGAADTGWGNSSNWNPKRAPVATDVITIPSGTPRDPVLTFDVTVNSLMVASGASLTLAGGDLTVTNALVSAGTIPMGATERVVFAGDGVQTVGLCNGTFARFAVEKSGGGVTFTNGFTVSDSFRCRATSAQALTFAAGETVRVERLFLNGLVQTGGGYGPALTLASTASGTAWRLDTTVWQDVRGVIVSDCDASGGACVRVGALGTDGEGNANWDFGATAAAAWTGAASADFGTAGNWWPERVPDASTHVRISGTDGAAAAVTLASSQPTTLASLTLDGADGAVTFTANARLVVTGDLFAATNTTTALNSFAEPNAVSNDVTVCRGATFTHTANGSKEAYKFSLDVGGDFLLETNGVFTATAKGYDTSGPKPGNRSQGACHGAAGGGYALTDCYGSIREPASLGSGNGDVVDGYGKGGGAIRLKVAGTCTLRAPVTANAGGQSSQRSAGGSVWIDAGTLVGEFAITADGRSPGAGGRIALRQRTATDWSRFTGAVSVSGVPVSGQTGGSGGTVYRETAADAEGEGELFIGHVGTTAIHPGLPGYDQPFGRVTVTNATTLRVADCTLAVTHGIDARGGTFFATNGTAGVTLAPDPAAPFSFAGTLTAQSFACSVPGAALNFLPDATVAVADGGSFALGGARGSNLVAFPAAADAAWYVKLGTDVLQDVRYVTVSNSDASVGSVHVSAGGSTDRGGNVWWDFVPLIEPGDPIEWTGAGDTGWNNGANWNPSRAPVETDVITIPSGCDRYPVVTVPVTVNSLTVASGASFTLGGVDFTVTNAFACAGTFSCAGHETLCFAGNGSQEVDLGASRYTRMKVVKTGGGIRFAHGFKTDEFAVNVTNAVTLAFAADAPTEIGSLALVGRGAETWPIALTGPAAETAWRLKVTRGASVCGVRVCDSDAREGVPIRAGALGHDDGRNQNWIFDEEAAAVWTGAGGNASFANPENWRPQRVPTNAWITVRSDDPAVTNAVTLAAGEAFPCAGLTLGGGDGTVAFRADAPMQVAGDLEIGKNATAAFNSFAEPNEVGGNVFVRRGATLTHTKNGSTEAYKLRMEVAGDLLVESGGAVNANGKGFSKGSGPGFTGHGGTHGGCADTNNVALVYCRDSIFEPVELGSGGYNGTWLPNGNGGGAIRLKVTGKLTANGGVTADAAGEHSADPAGGSVWIDVGTLAGGGTVSANGKGGQYMGGGGRIAVWQRSAKDLNAFTGSFSALGGPQATWSGASGGGTVYLQVGAAKGAGEIRVASRFEAGVTHFPMAVDGSVRSAYRASTLVIESGTVCLKNADDMGPGVRVRVKDLHFPNSGGTIDLCGNILEISSPQHKDGKGWTGTKDSHVRRTGGGDIVWRNGFYLFVR